MHSELNLAFGGDQSPLSVSALEASDYSRHRWYFFKEGFSPAFVDHAIKDSKLENDALVVDPFCGSGTVPLQAALTGLPSYGVEVNPFLAFVARTKLSRCSVRAFDLALLRAEKGTQAAVKSALEGFSTFSQKRGAKQWLFNTSVLRAFEGGWLATSPAQGPGSNLARLCLIEAAMTVCNAAKDGKCLRYRKNWGDLNFTRQNLLESLQTRAQIVRDDLENGRSLRAESRILRGDVRTKELPDKFALCVTSPPYLNSFDYTDVYRPELFLGRFVGSMQELRRLRLRTVRSHVQASWPRASEHEYGPLYSDSLRLIVERKERLWDDRIPEMIKAYFEDMECVLANLRRRASLTASVWIVISTSAYAGVEIPVDLIIADIAGTCGWYLREVRVLRHLARLSGQQWTELSVQKDSKPHLRESVVILDAVPRKPDGKEESAGSPSESREQTEPRESGARTPR
jgi:hypothetical protein